MRNTFVEQFVGGELHALQPGSGLRHVDEHLLAFFPGPPHRRQSGPIINGGQRSGVAVGHDVRPILDEWLAIFADLAAARAAWQQALTIEPNDAWVKFALLPSLDKAPTTR